ncbi:MAG: DUF5615 family PIN-like protein [Armatimonadetes bacterium]|nr:DUF5615 family PIN-like protein [Armatimonadota bacterium]
MRFKVDENLPVEAAELLQAAGYEADTVEEEGLRGAKDATLARLTCIESRAFVTLDLDFSDIRCYPPERHNGIIVLRTQRQDKRLVLSLIRRFIPLLGVEPLDGALWIVEADRVRIRGGSP